MSTEHITLKQWLENFENGLYSADDRDTQIKAGWYDWFCKDSSLRNKTYKLAPKVKRIARSVFVDTNKHYVFFKNNCPGFGKLYDDFRICDIETGEVIYTIIPSSGHESEFGESRLWGKDKNNNFSLLVSGTWQDVLNFFGVF